MPAATKVDAQVKAAAVAATQHANDLLHGRFALLSEDGRKRSSELLKLVTSKKGNISVLMTDLLAGWVNDYGSAKDGVPKFAGSLPRFQKIIREAMTLRDCDRDEPPDLAQLEREHHARLKQELVSIGYQEASEDSAMSSMTEESEGEASHESVSVKKACASSSLRGSRRFWTTGVKPVSVTTEAAAPVVPADAAPAVVEAAAEDKAAAKAALVVLAEAAAEAKATAAMAVEDAAAAAAAEAQVARDKAAARAVLLAGHVAAAEDRKKAAREAEAKLEAELAALDA